MSHDNPSPPPSPEYLAYRQGPGRAPWGPADDALAAAYYDAYDAIRKRCPRSWSDVAELAIVAHDHTWDRINQTYAGRLCPHGLIVDLILAALALQPGDARLWERPADCGPGRRILSGPWLPPSKA